MHDTAKRHHLLLACTIVLTLAANLCAQRSVGNFDRNWRFAKGAQSDEVTQADFDDSTWRQIRLPHDWAISGPFNASESGYAGKLPWRGEGWYRKTFTLDATDRGRRVYFEFDGVMAFPKVYVNGRLAGRWDYGYMSFRVDATPYVKFGATNVIAVHADTRDHGTRWYPGAGIYRKVTMAICSPIHIAHWGAYVTTPKVTEESATVRVHSTLENHLQAGTETTVDVTVLDPAGKTVVSGRQRVTIPAEGIVEADQSLTVPKPRRWDIETPRLYTVNTIIRVDDRVVDADRTAFGIRTFEFTADDGFFLNGRRVQLYGVNLHHDHGPLGAAFYRRAMERQLEIMREMGVNAIRTSHNPPAPELLDLCDRMGFVVWDEAFDKWDDKADRVRGEPPLEQYGEKQIRNLVLRDRNHPSIVVWSIGNEINNQPYDREGKSPQRVKFMSDFVRKYDPTRPVTMSCHIPGTADEPILDALDLTGWNYARRYARYRQNYPDKPIIYSESASALSTRGFYELPLPNGKTEYSKNLQVNSYDLNAAAWSDIAEAEFQLMEDDRFVSGEFVWTGFDYLGEPTPFTEQAKSSYFGIVDLCGIPKDRFYLYRSYWRPETTTVHILPHWNWPDRIGQKVSVFIYTNGDSAELFLDGQSLGRRTKGQAPAKPANFALNKPATASSEESDKGNVAANANDGDTATRWCASAAGAEQWWQVDLGQVQPVKYVFIDFEKEAKNYGYEIKVSTDVSTWTTIANKPTSRFPRWGGPTQSYHDVDTRARYVRVEFTDLRDQTWASMKEFGVYPTRVESPYYDVTYKYRLRWNDVIYQPGELKAVAYKDGQRIGEAVMRTAEAPATLRLTPDRTELTASGEDLCYILVEALDKNGTLCPLAEDLVHFEIEGPAEIAGVGNGNPLSLEPFQADFRRLFYGKAMLILRTQEGLGGTIRIRAESDGLTSAQISVESQSIADDAPIVLSSLGFLPDSLKKATIASSCTEFTVKDSITGDTVYSGQATGPVHQDDVEQDVWIADFSSVTAKGNYYLDVPGVGRSICFEIRDNIYDFAFKTAMRAFYLWRCGTAVEGTHNGQTYAHAACHTDDGWQDQMGIADQKRDGTGGWHDAGDYGKYVVNAGVTLGSLFLAWDHFHDRVEGISLDLPETAPGYPDFLKELKWETDWLLKMPYPDGSGKVSHKLTRLNFSGMMQPEDDDEKRYFTEWSTAATADFVAVMAMAARYFKPYDPQYAQTCLEAAQRSYALLKDHPDEKRFNQGPFRTGGYQTGDADDRLWAAAEMWETTGDPECLKDFETRAKAPRRGQWGRPASAGMVDTDWDWGNVRNLGMFTYILSERPGRETDLLETIRRDLLATADTIVAQANKDVYGRTLGDRYYWGCNGTVARQVLNLQIANRVSPAADYTRAALDAVSHLFGRNYYGRSYVTGLGHRPPMNPHDRRSASDGIEAPWPGYVVGGGHSATDWKDLQEDYRTNEIAINWQAALVYALAGFTSGAP